MPQQLHFLADAARSPPVASQRKQYAASKDRAPPSRPAASAQESLFAFQAVGHELLLLPNQDIASAPPPEIPPSPPTVVESAGDIQHVGVTAHGDKAKARDILAAIRTLKAIEGEQRSASPDERQTLASFPGFGVVALGIFPDPVSGSYQDARWKQRG